MRPPRTVSGATRIDVVPNPDRDWCLAFGAGTRPGNEECHVASDADKHRELLRALKAAQGKGDGAFEQAVTSAFEHVFEHLERLNSHVSLGRPDVEGRSLKAGESSTLR